MPPEVAMVVALVFLADVGVLVWLARGWGKRAAAHRQAYQVWLLELQTDPVRWQLYQAHWSWEARGRVILATILDIPLLFLLTYFPASLLARHLGLAVGSDGFFFLWLAVGLTLVLANTFGALRCFGSTLGLRLAGVAAVSSRTGGLAAKHELYYPSKQDYRRDRVLQLLFVPQAKLKMGGGRS